MPRRDGITEVISPITGKRSYRARASYVDADGGRYHRSKSFRTRREAERWRRETLSRIDRGDWFEAGSDTVAEIAGQWLATVERSRAPSTYRKYRKTYEGTVAPRFGARKVASLRASEIQSWYDALGREYAGNTVAMVHKVMRGIVGHAIANGIIRDNPLAGRRLPRDHQDPPVAWTPDAVRRFLAAVATDDDAIPLVVLLATGMRIGELLALAWEDVDLDARTVRVHRTLQQTPDGVRIAETAKTASSNRMVALPAVAVRALCRQRALACGPLVFARVDGRPMRAGTVRERLDAYCAQLGLPRITPHDLRRTAVSLMMAQGVHPSVAARQTGHTVSEMLRRYASVNVELQQQAADALDDVLSTD